MQVTLAKALRIKNKKVGELTKLRTKINQYNTYREDDTQAKDFDVNTMLQEEETLFNNIIKIKSIIKKETSAIIEKLTEMEELKGKASFLKNITARSSKQSMGGMSTAILETKVQVSRKDLDTKVTKIEETLQSIQDEVDEFNAKTKITLPDDCV